MQADGPNAAIDQKIRTHLEARGFAIDLLNQDASASSAAHARLVIMSSTISAKLVGPGWRQLPVPLLTWEDDMAR